MSISQTQRYKDYLASPKWLAFSTEAKVETGGRCQGCNKETWDLAVHHLTYERLGNEKASDVWVVCRRCHLKFHRHHKKRVNKERKRQGQSKIRGTLGVKKPCYRPEGLSIRKDKPKPLGKWTPEERERFLAEADALLKSRQ